MEAKNTLNGFEAILDTLNPHVGTKTKTEDNDTDVIDAAAEELTDEELEALFALKPELDNFFDNVFVNHENEKIKTNRKNLIGLVYQGFRKIADIKEITI